MGFIVRVGREDVLNMFRVWKLDGVLILCSFQFRTFAACMRARVIEFSDGEIRMLSDDTFSELTLRINNLDFRYGDPRDFPEEEKEFVRGLVALLPPVDRSDIKDTISFFEFK